ncbi:hypothetical protein [Pseudoalteromonas xiamenensis]|uniref:HEAT repeat domain-containing protein n=1 Tax=Pseudoalteromonas xiamenensis TaxID=882626 RepID=A0A975DN93_9GAMM|nr:hypothetical protein [Pseudoalteromonas xiamenensis]QTH73521.1 hypothetical protein J5O05_18695 [Pseudoalteromonas xiamenensis]
MMRNSAYLTNLLALSFIASTMDANAYCERQYDLTVTTISSFSMAGKSASSPSSLKMEASIALKQVQVDGENNWWGLLASNVRSVQATTETPLPIYQIPFAFKQSASGQIEQFWFPNTLPSQQQMMLKGLAYYFQVPKLKDAPFPEFESDTTGTYQVTYRTDDSRISYQKQKYIKLLSPSTQQVNVLDSKHQFQPDHCWFEEKSGRDTLETFTSSGAISLNTHQSYQLTKSSLQTSPLFSMSNKLDEWQVVETALTAQDLKKLKQTLFELIRSDLSNIDAHSLAMRLRPLDPVLQDLLPIFGKEYLSDAAQSRLLHALGNLDSANSQYLLVNVLMSYSSRPEIQFRSLRALAYGDAALSDQTVDSLTNALQNGLETSEVELQNNFYLTVGSIVRHRGKTKRIQQLHDALAIVATESNSLDRKKAAIGALGNTNDVQHLGILKKYAQEMRSPTQNVAIKALGRLNKPEAKIVLVDMLNHEVPKQTVTSLLKAVGDYQLSNETQNKVVQYVESDSEITKQAAIAALAKQSALSETARDSLKQQITKQSDRRTMQLIVNTLERSKL